MKTYENLVFEGAMSKYNESICLADNSEQLSLSYANRSQCFLKLHSYGHCLNDIRLAKEAGYPIHLMPKLEIRQSECMKHPDSKFVQPSTIPTCSESHQMISDSLRLAYFVFHAIMNSAKLALKFEQITQQRFLVHLIIHHYIVLRKNSFGYEKDGAYVT